MLKQLILIAFLFISLPSFAQKADSIFVGLFKNEWVIKHKVKAGENVFALARQFYAPPAMIADANNITFQQELKPNTFVVIPTGAYNFITTKPKTQDAKPLYFKADNEGLYKIARTSGVSQKQLQEWNKLMTNEVRKGQVLLIGWVRFDNTKLETTSIIKTKPVSNGIKVEEDNLSNRRRSHAPQVIYIPLPDTTTLLTDTLSEGEKQFFEQTQNGAVVVEEKGTGAFFQRAGRSDNGIYFAFHNTARRGTIIKIYNPGTDKTVYAKVIGTIPTRDIFYNTILGISSDAKAELETGSEKVWCEISYAP